MLYEIRSIFNFIKKKIMSTNLLLALQVTAFVCIGGVHASDDLTADEEELSKLIGVLGTVHIYSMISLFYGPGDQDLKNIPS